MNRDTSFRAAIEWCAALTTAILACGLAIPSLAQSPLPAREHALPSTQSAAPRDMAFDELPLNVQSMMREDASGTVPAWLEQHSSATFRILRRGPSADWQQVTLHDGGKEHGFLVFQHGGISVGNLDGKQFGSALIKSPTADDIPGRPLISSFTPARSPKADRTTDSVQSTSSTEKGGFALEEPSEEQPAAEGQQNVVPILAERPVAKDEQFTAKPEAPKKETTSSNPAEYAVKKSSCPWLPMTGGPELMWVASIIILALTIRTDRWISRRNLDGLVLAATCPLLLARSADVDDAGGWLGFSPRWWVYAALSGAALYWLVRGALLARSLRAAGHPCNVSPGAMLVLLLFACGILGTRVVTSEPSASSIDGVLGGRGVNIDGKLPYGRIPGYDTQSPLIYLLHAGAMKLTPAYVRVEGNLVPPEWSTRESWLRDGWTTDAELTPVRVVNGLLAILTLAALVQIGRRLHSLPAGLTMAAMFGVFPGTVECVNDPAVMLPAMLLAWSIALSTLRRFGGLLSTSTTILAGIAWPYAWLMLPVLAAYFARSSWRGLGTTIGIAGAAAGSVAGLTALVAPTMPRADAAMRAAGERHEYSIEREDNGNWGISKIETADVPATSPDLFKKRIWERLLSMESVTLAQAIEQSPERGIKTSTGITPSSIMIRHVKPIDVVDERSLSELYVQAVNRLRFDARAAVALRTVLEAAWLGPSRHASGGPSAWAFFEASQADATTGGLHAAGPSSTATATSEPATSVAERWSQYRRITKIGAAVWSVLLAGAFLFGKPRREHNIVGAILSISAWITIAQSSGATDHLPFLIVAALPLLAANHESKRESTSTRSKSDGERSEGVASSATPRTLKLGPPPRISVE